MEAVSVVYEKWTDLAGVLDWGEIRCGNRGRKPRKISRFLDWSTGKDRGPRRRSNFRIGVMLSSIFYALSDFSFKKHI